MKKILSFVFVFWVFSLVSTTFAKGGDSIGVYYSTDIKTYVNGTEIDAINVGGQTYINAEIMNEYGFGVLWNSQARTLSVTEKATSDITASYTWTKKTPFGVPIGYYYETDIITYLDNKPIVACNTGGVTYIHAEQMNEFGYLVTWNPDLRILNIESPIRAGYVYDIPILEGKKQEKEGEGYLIVRYEKDNSITFEGDGEYLSMKFYSSQNGYTFITSFYQNAGLFYSIKLIDKLKTLCYDGYGIDMPSDKNEKYDLVNKMIYISINGRKAEKVSVIAGAGNGHRDFEFYVEDLPRLKKEEIEEINFSIL